MTIISHANHGGPGASWVSELFNVILGHVSHMRFFSAYNFLLKRDRATGMVPLRSACHDLLIDMHTDFLRSPFGLKGT